MSDKNIKDESINSYEGYEYITFDDGVVMSAEPADETTFVRLYRQGYTILKDEDGNIIAAVAPKREA